MMRKDAVFAAEYLLLSVGLYYFSWILLAISIMASLIILIRKHLSENSMKWMLAGAAGLIVLSLVVVVFFGILSLGISNIGGTQSTRSAMVASDYATVENAAAPGIMTKSMAVLGAGEGAINVPTREGVLPVRLELPALGKTITVKSHLVNSKDPLKISILVIAGWLKYVLYLASLAAGILCLKRYRKA
jgi:hypothetical protein